MLHNKLSRYEVRVRRILYFLRNLSNVAQLSCGWVYDLRLNDGGTSFYRFLVLDPVEAERCQAGSRRLRVLGGVVGIDTNIFIGEISGKKCERRRAPSQPYSNVALRLRKFRMSLTFIKQIIDSTTTDFLLADKNIYAIRIYG